MTGAAQQAGALAALVTLLLRGGSAGPSALAVAGAVGLAVYAALALAPPLVRTLTAPPRSPDA